MGNKILTDKQWKAVIEDVKAVADMQTPEAIEGRRNAALLAAHHRYQQELLRIQSEYFKAVRDIHYQYSDNQDTD